MTRLPLLVSFVLFLALCASLAYRALQLFAPAPRAVSAPPQAERKVAPIAAAGNLFGGHAQANTMANMILRGVIYVGRSGGSEAILVTDNAPPKYVKVSAEVTDGVTVKEIHPRHVVLDDHGVSREVSLPSFAPTPASTANLNANSNTNFNANAGQSPQPALSAAPPEQQPAQNQPAPPNNQGMNASGASAASPSSAAPSTARSATNPR